MKTKLLIVSLFFAAFALNSCFLSPNEGNGRIVIDNNDKNFGGRIVKADETIELNRSSESLGKVTMVSVPQDFRLILRAEVNPPEYEGFTLRASHIAINDGMAYVSYNREGPDYLGGIEIFDVSDIDNPALVSQAIFTDTDISTVTYDNNKLYLSGATNTDINLELTSPAIIERVNLNLLGELTDNTTQIDISSYVGTGVGVYEDFILATSGSEGDLVMLDRNSLDVLSTSPISDARYVAVSDEYIAVLSASPATLHVITISDPTTINTYVIGGETISESKSTVAIDGDLAYVTLNDGGLKVINIANGSVLYEMERPTTPVGEDELDYVTNGVSINNDLIFIANGAAGVFVGSKYNGSDIEIYGTVDLNSSTNFVEGKDDIIFVATGFGGFKILEVQRTAFEDSPVIASEGAANFAYKYGGVRYKSFANTGSKEHYLGMDDLGIASNRVETNYTWTSPGEHTFTFEYDPQTYTLSSNIDSNASVLNYVSIAPEEILNTLQIDVVGRSDNASISLKNLVVDGYELGTFDGDGWKTWKFTNFDVSDGFVVSGIIDIEGVFESSDELDKINLLLGYVDPTAPEIDDSEDEDSTVTTITQVESGSIFIEKYAHARYTSFKNTNSNEHFLGKGDLSVEENRVEGAFEWLNPGEHSIRIVYDPLEHTITSQIDSNGSELTYDLETFPINRLNTIQIDVAERSNKVTVNLKDLTIDGILVGDFEGDGWKSYSLTGMNFDDGIVLTATLEVSGNFSSTHDKDLVDITFGHASGLNESDEIQEWQASGQTYYIGDKVSYNDQVYECLQTHTNYGDMNWAPGVALSLWALVENED